MKKQKQTISCLQESPLKYKDINPLKTNKQKIIPHANTNPKKAGW
jgi:hypothetical protein